MKTTTTRMTHVALATVLVALAGTVSAQTYTIKVGGAYIDPRATSSDLSGTVPIVSSQLGGYVGNVNTNSGAQWEVKPKSTLIFSIERSFTPNWSAELLLGIAPKHDVVLNSSAVVFTGGSTPTASNALVRGAAQAHLQGEDGTVVATVRQNSPTIFANYTFLESSAPLRPYLGIGVNYTKMSAKNTDAGYAVYNDGPVRISVSDSFGLAFQMGARYQIDKHWLVNAAWATAGVKNDVTIQTDHARQDGSYRFHASVFMLTAGYSF